MRPYKLHDWDLPRTRSGYFYLLFSLIPVLATITESFVMEAGRALSKDGATFNEGFSGNRDPFALLSPKVADSFVAGKIQGPGPNKAPSTNVNPQPPGIKKEFAFEENLAEYYDVTENTEGPSTDPVTPTGGTQKIQLDNQSGAQKTQPILSAKSGYSATQNGIQPQSWVSQPVQQPTAQPRYPGGSFNPGPQQPPTNSGNYPSPQIGPANPNAGYGQGKFPTNTGGGPAPVPPSSALSYLIFGPPTLGQGPFRPGGCCGKNPNSNIGGGYGSTNGGYGRIGSNSGEPAVFVGFLPHKNHHQGNGGAPGYGNPKEEDYREWLPHCFVKTGKSKEFVGFTSLSEAFHKLNLTRAVRDIQRYNYICKPAESSEEGVTFLGRGHHVCGQRMGLIKSPITNDGYIWRCNACRKALGAYIKKSVRYGSFFSKSHVPLGKLVTLVYFWAIHPAAPRHEIQWETGVMDPKTVTQWYHFIREICQQWAEDNANPQMLGGQGQVVEIDESKLYKAKYNRGRGLRRRHKWVFGLLERNSHRVVLLPVDKRDAATLIPLIGQWVHPGSIIVSDPGNFHGNHGGGFQPQVPPWLGGSNTNQGYGGNQVQPIPPPSGHGNQHPVTPVPVPSGGYPSQPEQSYSGPIPGTQAPAIYRPTAVPLPAGNPTAVPLPRNPYNYGQQQTAYPQTSYRTHRTPSQGIVQPNYVPATNQPPVRPNPRPYVATPVPVPQGYRSPTPVPIPSGYGNRTPAPIPPGYGNPTPVPIPSGYGNATPAPVQPSYGKPTPVPVPSNYGNVTPVPIPSGYVNPTRVPIPSGYGNATPAPNPSGYGSATAVPVPSNYNNRKPTPVPLPQPRPTYGYATNPPNQWTNPPNLQPNPGYGNVHPRPSHVATPVPLPSIPNTGGSGGGFAPPSRYGQGNNELFNQGFAHPEPQPLPSSGGYGVGQFVPTAEVGNSYSGGTAAQWNEWQGWGACQYGNQFRARTCRYGRQIGAHGCHGESVEARICSATRPPVPDSYGRPPSQGPIGNGGYGGIMNRMFGFGLNRLQLQSSQILSAHRGHDCASVHPNTVPEGYVNSGGIKPNTVPRGYGNSGGVNGAYPSSGTGSVKTNYGKRRKTLPNFRGNINWKSDEISWSPPEEGFYPSASASSPAYFEAIYCGTLPLPQLASSNAVVPWIVEELAQEAKDNESAEIFLRVHGGSLRGMEQTRGRVIFDHPLASLSHFSRSKHNPNTFSYLLRDASTGYVSCSVFELPAYDQVLSLFFAIRDQNSDSNVPPILSSQPSSSFPGANDPVSRIPSSVSEPASLSSVLTAACSGSTSPRPRRSHPAPLESLSSFSQFEVLYVGRVEVEEPRKSSDYKTLVDEAVNNFDRLQTDHLLENSPSKKKGTRNRTWSIHSLMEEEEPEDEEVFPANTPATVPIGPQIRKISCPARPCSEVPRKSSIPSASSFFSHLSPGKTSTAIRKSSYTPMNSPEKRPGIEEQFSDWKQKRKSSSRAMLLLIGTKEIRLISLDKKATLLRRSMLDICTIIQGFKFADHVGFMCNSLESPEKSRLVTYVVRCQSSAIADSVMQSMKTAFYGGLLEMKESSMPPIGPPPNNSTRSRDQHLCKHCPLFQFANLCRDLEGLEPLRAHGLILQRIGQLDACDQEKIIVEYKSLCEKRSLLDDIPEEEEKSSSPQIKLSSGNLSRRNVALMALLRGLCASSQTEHDESQRTPSHEAPPRINLSGTSPPRPRSSSVGMEGLSKLLILRDKARKSLSNSLENIGKKSEVIAVNLIDRLNGDESPKKWNGNMVSPSPPESPSLRATFNFDTPDERCLLHPDDPLSGRPRSRTCGDEIFKSGKTTSSPKFNLLSRLQEGSSPAKKTLSALGASLDQQDGTGPLNRSYHSVLRTPLTSSSAGLSMAQESLSSPRKRRMSWRQAIFSRVVSPRLNTRASLASLTSCLPPGYDPAFISPDSRRSSCLSMVTVSSGLSGENGRRGSLFYKSLWKKAIMEQILQNRLQAQDRLKEEELEKLREMKLNYEEITPCPEEVVRPRWESYIDKANKGSVRLDRVLVEDALKAGIPRSMRFKVWNFLKQQHELDKRALIRMETAPPYCYRDLLKDLTSYQHAILIDLGRTFPTHPYFAQQLGPGQLSLFNILKAYSLYDPEVGYCQGLSFIAGALLLHMDEEDAFDMLVCLMFRFGLRKQFRPDMLALQIYMYQLSRLLHDRHKDLHTHLEDHEIPMLYAAPWFLTLFASTFPLGFVARVFDFIFFSGGIDVVFKIALVLLGEHKELIKQCDSFESINDFLKSTLPGMSIIQMERIFNAVMEFDLNRELLAYEVEYHVLQEEMLASPAPALGHPPHPLPDQGGSPDMSKRGSLGQTTAKKGKVEEDSDSGSSVSVWELEKLETAKKNLKRQNMELLEQLQQAHLRVQLSEQNRNEVEQKLRSSEYNVENYKCKVQSLESRVEALELERKSLLNVVDDLRRRIEDSAYPVCNGQSPPLHNGLSNGVPTSRMDSDDSGLDATPAPKFKESPLKNAI